MVLQILTTKTIPRETNLAQWVANWTVQPVARITTTPRHYARAFLIDTNGFFGTAAGNLPYTQPIIGSTNLPINARVDDRLEYFSRSAGRHRPAARAATS